MPTGDLGFTNSNRQEGGKEDEENPGEKGFTKTHLPVSYQMSYPILVIARLLWSGSV
jgi:hypothetical protein